MNRGMRQPPKNLQMAEMLIAEERRKVVEENELIKLYQRCTANKIDWYKTIATRVLYHSKIYKNTIKSLDTQYNIL
jgi:hypothetical protein